MDTLTAQKKELRRRILQMRREFLATSAGERAAKIIVDKAIESRHFQKAHKIMAYASQVGELPLYDFLQKAQSMGKEIFLPGRGEKPGEMFALRLEDFAAALPPWGVWHEPTTKEILPPEELDLIIVPGAAFSFHGARLGMGGGYYDRFLPRAVGAYRLALALDCQILPEIPADIHDEKVNGIITETGSHHNRK